MDSQFLEAWPRYLGGDKNAFGVIYSSAHPRLTLYCLSIVRDQEVAKNVASESLLKLLEQENPGGIQNPSSWLFTVAKNSCNSWWSTKQRRAEILDQAKNNFSSISRADALDNLEQESYNRIIIESLDGAEHSIWRLHLDGFDNREIADKMKMAEKTVANKKTSARQKLRLAFAHEKR